MRTVCTALRNYLTRVARGNLTLPNFVHCATSMPGKTPQCGPQLDVSAVYIKERHMDYDGNCSTFGLGATLLFDICYVAQANTTDCLVNRKNRSFRHYLYKWKVPSGTTVSMKLIHITPHRTVCSTDERLIVAHVSLQNRFSSPSLCTLLFHSSHWLYDVLAFVSQYTVHFIAVQTMAYFDNTCLQKCVLTMDI